MNQQDLELVDEQLTAYLDGELSAQEATALEQDLVVDEKLRLRLAELRKAYELLDDIPETPHNQRFTKSTMELVVSDLKGVHSTAPLVTQKSNPTGDWWAWPRGLIWVISLAATGSLIAFAVSFASLQSELGSLGLYSSIRGLQDVVDLETAAKLSQEAEVLAVLKQRFGDEVVPLPPASRWERKDWVQSLSSTQISRLKSGRDMLNRMDKSERARWIALQSKLENLPNGTQIQEAVNLIGKMLDIKPRARDELEGMNQEQRIIFLRNELCYRAAEYYTQHLPTADAKALDDWNRNSLNAALIQEHPSSRSNETSDLLTRLLFLKRPGFDRQEELVEELSRSLTKTGAKILEGISRKEDQLLILYFWLFPDRVRGEQVILDDYENLDKGGRKSKESRDRVDLGDPAEFRKNLREALGPSRRP